MTPAPRPSSASVYSDADIVSFEQLLSHNPKRKGRMLPRDARNKYNDITDPAFRFSRDEITAHLEGTATYAESMIGHDGLASEIGADVDHGGKAALKAILAGLKRRGIVAYAITSKNDEQNHDGGHIRARYNCRFEPERGRALISEVAAEVRTSVEPYPSGQLLRWHFGKHTWTGQRGTAIFQDDTEINLDGGPDAIKAAIQDVKALPLNTIDTLPVIDRPKQTRQEPRLSSCEGKSVIQEFNRLTDAITLIEGFGGRVSERYSDGSALVHCPCGKHKHGDRRASLLIKPGKQKKHAVFGYSPNCAFYTESGQCIDAVGIICYFEHLTYAEFVKKYAPPREYTPTQRYKPPLPEPEPPRRELSPAERQQRAAERREEAQAIQAEIRTRAAVDPHLSANDRHVLEAMLAIAGDRAWCRPSVARLAEMTQLSERTVQRSLAKLKAYGYIEDDPATAKGGHSTTIRRFLRVTANEAEIARVSPELSIKLDLNTPAELTCERARAMPTAEPAPPAPESEPQPVIAFEEGASYTPVDLPDVPAPEWRSSLTPKEFYIAFRAEHDRREQERETYQRIREQQPASVGDQATLDGQAVPAEAVAASEQVFSGSIRRTRRRKGRWERPRRLPFDAERHLDAIAAEDVDQPAAGSPAQEQPRGGSQAPRASEVAQPLLEPLPALHEPDPPPPRSFGLGTDDPWWAYQRWLGTQGLVSVEVK